MGNGVSKLTEQAIRAAFLRLLEERPLDEISVKEIAAECTISRKTFYNHFTGLDALVEELLQEEKARLFAMGMRESSWFGRFLRLHDDLMAGRARMLHIYRSHLHHYLKDYIFSISRLLLEDYTRGQPGGLLQEDEDMKAIISYHAGAMAHLFIDWIRGGMADDLEGKLRSLSRLVTGSIRFAADNRENK